MSPAEWTALANTVGAIVTALLVAVSTALLQRAQTKRLQAETQKVLKEVRPNGGTSSHDALVREIRGVKALTETQGQLLTTHIAESTTDRASIHLIIDPRPWDRPEQSD